MIPAIDITQYSDYRSYLRAFYQAQKARQPSYSYRVFARKARLASPNYLKLVMDGTRKLNERMLPLFARGLGLDAPRVELLRAMIQLEAAKDSESRRELERTASSLRKKLQRTERQVSDETCEVFENWYPLVIREMLTLKDFDPSPAWIARRISRYAEGRVTSAQVTHALECLERLGFVTRDAQGRLTQAEPLLATTDELLSPLIRKMQRQMARLGIESMDSVPLAEREIGGLILGVPRSRLPELKQALKAFRREINRLHSVEGQTADEIYYLSMQMFPITGPGVGPSLGEDDHVQTNEGSMDRGGIDDGHSPGGGRNASRTGRRRAGKGRSRRD